MDGSMEIPDLEFLRIILFACINVHMYVFMYVNISTKCWNAGNTEIPPKNPNFGNFGNKETWNYVCLEADMYEL